MTAIEVSGLTKRFGDVVAVDDLSFTVARGSITGFLGPNGAGKTTTLRALLGLITPSAGTARFGGRSYVELERPVHEIGAVLENGAWHPGRRARDHLRVLAMAAGVPMPRVDEVLELVGLTSAAKRRVKGFSLGMRQRLALAAALLGKPEILILDEPTNGLDPQGIAWLRGFLRSFADGGGTVLVSSHQLAEIAQTVDHVVIVSGGKLIKQASIAELGAESGTDLESAFLQLTTSSTTYATNGAL